MEPPLLRSEGFRLALAYFDDRRGNHEGEEHEKLLAFYPANASLNARISIVGLAQAYTSFATSFSEVRACECAAQLLHAMHSAAWASTTSCSQYVHVDGHSHARSLRAHVACMLLASNMLIKCIMPERGSACCVSARVRGVKWHGGQHAGCDTLYKCSWHSSVDALHSCTLYLSNHRPPLSSQLPLPSPCLSFVHVLTLQSLAPSLQPPCIFL